MQEYRDEFDRKLRTNQALLDSERKAFVASVRDTRDLGPLPRFDPPDELPGILARWRTDDSLGPLDRISRSLTGDIDFTDDPTAEGREDGLRRWEREGLGPPTR